MAKYMKCDVGHDCFNCPHPDCIDGKIIPKKKTAAQEAKEIINKKYNLSEAAKDKRRKRSLDYKHNHKESVYAVNKIYAEKHPDKKKYIARKYARMQMLKTGTAKIVGTAMINGKEIIIYGTNYRNKWNYWYMFGKDYAEIDEKEIIWLWVERKNA